MIQLVTNTTAGSTITSPVVLSPLASGPPRLGAATPGSTPLIPCGARGLAAPVSPWRVRRQPIAASIVPDGHRRAHRTAAQTQTSATRRLQTHRKRGDRSAARGRHAMDVARQSSSRNGSRTEPCRPHPPHPPPRRIEPLVSPVARHSLPATWSCCAFAPPYSKRVCLAGSIRCSLSQARTLPPSLELPPTVAFSSSLKFSPQGQCRRRGTGALPMRAAGGRRQRRTGEGRREGSVGAEECERPLTQVSQSSIAAHPTPRPAREPPRPPPTLHPRASLASARKRHSRHAPP